MSDSFFRVLNQAAQDISARMSNMQTLLVQISRIEGDEPDDYIKPDGNKDTYSASYYNTNCKGGSYNAALGAVCRGMLRQINDTILAWKSAGAIPERTTISQLVQEAHSDAVKAGWWSDLKTGKPKERNKAEQLMLMVSEIAEAMEGLRKNLNDDHLPHRPMVEVELADCVIRIADFCGAYGYDLEGAIIEKLAYNRKRADHKVENRKQEGGKQF